MSGSNLLILGDVEFLCCIPKGITATEKILVTKSSQAELSSTTGASGAPGSQDNPCFCSPLSLFQDFSCNVLHFCHPSLVLAEKRRRPSSCRNRCGCAKVQAGVGEGNSLFPQSPGKQGENFLLEFPLHGQLIPLGAGSDRGDAQRGQDTGAEASGTRTSCELLANPRSLCLVPAPEDPTGI